MHVLKRFRPSPAMVVACLALLLALGGTGYAAIKLPRNSVTTVQVKDFSLLSRDFKPGQIPRGAAGPAGPRFNVSGPEGHDFFKSGRTLAEELGKQVAQIEVG